MTWEEYDKNRFKSDLLTSPNKDTPKYISEHIELKSLVYFNEAKPDKLTILTWRWKGGNLMQIVLRMSPLAVHPWDRDGEMGRTKNKKH